jgi:predicted CoA-substrate-specific enzyme activase
MLKVGIDLGSRFVKIAVQDADNIEFKKIDTIQFYKNYISKVNDKLILNLNLEKEIDSIVATGYGRNMINFTNADIISEIKAHFKGAVYQTSLDNFTLIDIGGQDSKVISVKDGFIDDFSMNDKCAASTGRFIENTCNILDISIDDFSNCVKNPVKMNSTCAIFSESEVIGKIAEGFTIEEIAAGISESIAKRFAPMVRKYRNTEIFASGGVSQIYSIRYFLNKILDTQIKLLPNPQYNGAIGCLFYT